MPKLTSEDLKRLEDSKEVLKEYLDELKKLEAEKESKTFLRSKDSFLTAINKMGPLPFKREFNAVYWAYDLMNVSNELVISFCWMEAYANQYKKSNLPGTKPSQSSVQVSFFADNCVTLIDLFKDKLALMVLAYYHPFNPEKKTLIYEEVVERLKTPKKFNLRIKNQKPFLNYLEKFKEPHFKIIEKQRHLKIHRLSPRIEIYKTGSQHFDHYMLPLTDQKEIKAWKNTLLKECKNDSSMAGIIERGCYIDGILYDRRPLKGRLFEYKNVRRDVKFCLLDSLFVLSRCLNLLKRRIL